MQERKKRMKGGKWKLRIESRGLGIDVQYNSMQIHLEVHLTGLVGDKSQ